MTALLGRHRARLAVALAGMTCIGLAVAGCGSSSAPAAGGTSAAPASTAGSAASASASKGTGSVDLAYAASLTYLNSKIVGPAFTKAAGYTVSGRAGPSGALAAEIASGEISPGVFESVGGTDMKPLEPKYTKWYVQYAGSSIVVAYNPKSKYASQFKAIADGTKPVADLFTLLQAPGLKLGRTDPNVDPQGRDFIEMLELAQSYYHLPSDTVAKILGTSDFGSASSSQIYAEASLDSTLESGQLDASSAFVTQAVELHLPYIALPAAINLGSFANAAAYKKATVQLTNGKVESGGPQVIDITAVGTPAPAAIAFIRYTLSQAGLAEYKQGGFTVLTPTAFGDSSAIPAAIQSELGG